jgi:hypothetical protein
MFIGSMLLGLVSLLPGSSEPVPGNEDVAFFVGAVVLAIFAGLTVWLTLKIYRGRNWARWTMLVYLAPTWVLGMMDFSETFTRLPVVGVVAVVATVMEIVACWMLFIGSGAGWFLPRAPAPVAPRL